MTRIGGDAHGQVDTYPHRADRRMPGVGQTLVVVFGAGLLAGSASVAPAATGAALILTIQLLFTLAAAWRAVLVLMSRRIAPDPPPAPVLPRYTVMAALLDEAEILPQLVARLDAIDYPRDRLEGFLLLEAHDTATRTAATDYPLPSWLTVLVVPPGGPRTKPSALNAGLAAASGALLTVYDAEDDPDPLQLREAAARFAADPTGRLATLQAPLRIRPPDPSGSPFLDRQFAVEYAALFEVTLPAMARLGLPFPLGGTSNHFRVEALRAVGGWDAHNVTEDADLGFRLWRCGYRLGTLRRPTWETPPGDMIDWLPQRTRWLKGFMQTWGVHTRTLSGLGWRGVLALVMTLGMSLAAASAHALSLAWVVATVGICVAAGMTPDSQVFAFAVLGGGLIAAWINGAIGAYRAGVPYQARDMLMAPAYWSLLTLAFFHALWRLVAQPFTWDKTRHRRDPAIEVAALAEVDAGREAA
ncbi:glycosyltransferase family 2 protein [Brevundimonas staleyi]|uniref:Glycosyltransferase family 2 protein n=1 Tax=Brevundimonas staleyi TaxID=74326 RepID=A0ABW0FU72_9CAUL